MNIKKCRKYTYKKCTFENGDQILFYDVNGIIVKDKISQISRLFNGTKKHIVFNLIENENTFPCFVIKNITKNAEILKFQSPLFNNGQAIIYKNKKGIIIQLGEINRYSHKKYYDIKTDRFYYRISEERLTKADSP